MKLADILALLSEHREEIKGFGVQSLRLFGSASRDEAREHSDVDIVVEFTETPGYLRYTDLKFFLEDLLGCPVDLTTPDALKPHLRDVVMKEAIQVPGL